MLFFILDFAAFFQLKDKNLSKEVPLQFEGWVFPYYLLNFCSRLNELFRVVDG